MILVVGRRGRLVAVSLNAICSMHCCVDAVSVRSFMLVLKFNSVAFDALLLLKLHRPNIDSILLRIHETGCKLVSLRITLPIINFSRAGVFDLPNVRYFRM